MTPEMIAVLIVGGLVAVIVAFVIYKKMPRRLNQKKFTQKWRNLQQHCKDKSTWKDAVIEADKLLDSALKQRRFKGKTPGERLVSAQRKFSNNDAVWSAHNVYKKLQTKPDMKLSEEQTKQALSSFRQALRELGALPSGGQQK